MNTYEQRVMRHLAKAVDAHLHGEPFCWEHHEALVARARALAGGGPIEVWGGERFRLIVDDWRDWQRLKCVDTETGRVQWLVIYDDNTIAWDNPHIIPYWVHQAAEQLVDSGLVEPVAPAGVKVNYEEYEMCHGDTPAGLAGD